MLENNENAELRAEIDRLKNVVEFTGGHLKKWSDQWEQAKALIEGMFEDRDEDSLGSYERDLVDLFDISFTEETEVVINVSWTVTVTHPKGYNLGDLDISIDEPELFSTTGKDIEVGHFYSPDVEIEEA